MALGSGKHNSGAAEGEPNPDKVSDVLALIGTTILWVFWPSFVGATEVGDLDNEIKCFVNAVCVLLAEDLAPILDDLPDGVLLVWWSESNLPDFQ